MTLDEKLREIITSYAINSSGDTEEAITAIKKAFEEELPKEEELNDSCLFAGGLTNLQARSYNRCLSEIKQKLWGSK